MVKLLAALATVVVLLAGLWVVTGVLAPGYDGSILLGVAWFVAASVAIGALLRRRPELKLPVRGAFLATAAAVAAVFAWTTFRDDEVDEDVVTAGPSRAMSAGMDGERPPERPRRNVELASAELEPLAHGPASGTARAIRLPGGDRVLTLSDGFEVDNGPDLRVYLTTSDGESAGDFVDLGELKGNKGDQQYRIPERVDLGTHSTVSVWCRAFSVGFARARLSRG